ncbi:hypothetical protein [Pseudoalteromonas lipolytica]|uniref:hypothetical protein n=1 Tax=Pseudoalteromonas lipolytica TaxID=570156 RepID=UPI0030B6E97F
MMKKYFLAGLYTVIGYFSVPVIANSQTEDFKAVKHMLGQEGSQYSDSSVVYALLHIVAIIAPLIITITFSPKYAGKPLKASWKWWLSLFSSVGLIIVCMFYLIISGPITS